MDAKYLLKIFIVTFLILSLILFINSIGLNLDEPEPKKELIKVITMEGLEMNPIITDSSKAFCDSNKGGQQEKACNALTEYNCNLTSCCIWTGDKKCKAGNASGPLFNTDSNGKTIHLPYYFFQNKCYGSNCPSE